MTQKFRKNRAGAKQSDAFSRLMENSAPGAEKMNTGPAAARSAGKRRGTKRLLLWLIVLVCFVLLAFCGMGIAGHKLAVSPYNMPNVYVGGINVGGLSKDDTARLLEEKDWDARVSGQLQVSLPAGTGFELGYVDSGAELSIQQAVDAAYEQGRESGMFDTLFAYLKSFVYSVDVNDAEKQLNEDYIRAAMERGIAVMQHATSASGYDLDTENSVLIMTKGGGQLQIDGEGLYAAISQALINHDAELRYDTLEDELKMPDFKALYEKLAVEPQDAYFTENFEIVPEVVGCSFDVSEAEKLWSGAAPGEQIRIPLTLSYPENNEESLQALLYRDMLGSQTTYYNWSTNNRINNIHLAAEKINGLVLLPGEVFSFNNAVGQRTQAAGFLMAGVYNDGQVMEDIGGGICQVSSTLYCAQMYAQLKTTNRVNHHFKVDYLDYGMDATVSWKTPDYKFTNSREYPVKIVAYCDDENFALTIEIWGTDTDGSYVTLRQTSEALYDGMYTSVLVAYKVRTFRDVYDAEGNLLETISEPFGTYHLHDEDIDWPPEKYEQELKDFSDPLDLLEKEKEKENGGTTVNPDDLLPSYDIYS